MMEMTCHPRLGGARPKGGRGSSESSADSVILFYEFTKGNYRKDNDLRGSLPPSCRDLRGACLYQSSHEQK